MNPSLRNRILFFLVFAVIPQAAHSAPPQLKKRTPPAAVWHTFLPQEVWCGVFIESQRVGYLHFHSTVQKYKNIPVTCEDTTMHLQVGDGKATEKYHHTKKALRRKSDDSRMEEWEIDSAAGTVEKIHHVFSVKQVVEEKDKGTVHKRRVLSRTQYNHENISTGPLSSLSFDAPRDWSALHPEIITVAWKPVMAYRVEAKPTSKSSKERATVWVDRTHSFVRADVLSDGGNIRFERMSRIEATAPLSIPLQLDTITAASPIVDARTLRHADYLVAGIADSPAITDDDVQTTSLSPQGGTKFTLFSVKTGPAADAPPTPLNAIPRDRFARFLQSGPLTPADSPTMKALAQQIVGSETDARKAAVKLDHWVHENLSYDWAYGGYRTAAQTLKERKGVCQNYATLLVTLARAAGLPAKYCSGAAYMNDGKFYRHAWAEIWVGKWVAFEPTWGVAFADAARLKFAEGEPDAVDTAWQGNAKPFIAKYSPPQLPPFSAYKAPKEPEVPTVDKAELDAAAKLAKQIADTAAV